MRRRLIYLLFLATIIVGTGSCNPGLNEGHNKGKTKNGEGQVSLAFSTYLGGSQKDLILDLAELHPGHGRQNLAGAISLSGEGLVLPTIPLGVFGPHGEAGVGCQRCAFVNVPIVGVDESGLPMWTKDSKGDGWQNESFHG